MKSNQEGQRIVLLCVQMWAIVAKETTFGREEPLDLFVTNGGKWRE